jgi:hypothetical protein
LIAAAVVIGLAALTAYSNVKAQIGTNGQSWSGSSLKFPGNQTVEMHCFMPRAKGRWGGGFKWAFVEVSEDFKNNVIKIAENDSDVQKLLSEGYNITDVRPIIKATVQGDGTVTMKATEAILTLEKETSHATVKVNLEKAQVEKITILTKTVIEKP